MNVPRVLPRASFVQLALIVSLPIALVVSISTSFYEFQVFGN
jgi:hypothetical protein